MPCEHTEPAANTGAAAVARIIRIDFIAARTMSFEVVITIAKGSVL